MIRVGLWPAPGPKLARRLGAGTGFDAPIIEAGSTGAATRRP